MYLERRNIKVRKSLESVGMKKKERGHNANQSLKECRRALPSLLRERTSFRKGSKVGFDWKKTGDVFEKMNEELKEFRKALKNKKQPEIEDELGDIFFMLVNISRFVGVNPEDPKRKQNKQVHLKVPAIFIEMKAADRKKPL